CAVQESPFYSSILIQQNNHNKYPAWSYFPHRAGETMLEKMSSSVVLTALFTLPFAVGWVILGDSDKPQVVCVGKEFRLPFYSRISSVTFTPNSPPGPRRVLMENNIVKDQRFEWTKDRELVLKEVTFSDQGLYTLTLSEMIYQMIRLTVSECIKRYRRNYGENLELSIPDNSSLLEFSPKGAPPEATPIVLWNQTNPDSNAGQGRIIRNGKAWLVERVTQADQGNYTLRDGKGKVLSRCTLTVQGRISNITRFTKESLNLPLFLPVPHAYLIFTPAREPDESSLGPFDPRPPSGPVQLIREGQIIDHDMRYRGLISVGKNGAINEVTIMRLTSRHDGVYEIRDKDGNLVSSTSLQVVEKVGRWRAVLKSIYVPSCLFVSLAGFILFLKRTPTCSISKIITGAGLRANHTPPANPPRVNIQDYSQPNSQLSGFYGYSQQPETQRKWSPRASPAHTGYTTVMVGTGSQLPPVSMRPANQESHRLLAGSSAGHNSTEHHTFNVSERKVSFSLAGASDCLHSSEDCVQFQLKKNGDKEKLNKSKDYFSTLPLDMDASESCSVYTSDKLHF
ncbi:hypothetical protein LDENG_00036820, partial [Lucifuga dentata]